MIAAVCELCGKPYQTYPSVLAAGRKYCSNACRHLAHKRRVVLICEHCGREYETHEFQGRKGRRFCSWECRNLGLQDRKKQTCEYCRKEFEVTPCQTARGWGRFCSWECRVAGMCAEKSQSWKGGIAPRPYPRAFSAKLKTRIRKRDKYRCAVCKLKGMNVHHIDYDKHNNEQDNLVVLCGSCHGATNHNRDYWRRALGQMMKTRRSYA
jgi:hypothetical protein